MSDSPMRREVHRVVKVEEVKQEAKDVFTLYFKDNFCSSASPGQFIMVWIPGVDEIPMSLSTINQKGVSSITVRSVGEATRILCETKVGEKIGVRGPFGNGFTLKGSKPVLVGGGTGVPALYPLASKMLISGIKPSFILGARNAEQLLFKDRLQEILDDLIISTDDGSLGFKGYASECLGRLILEKKCDSIYTCGPEQMIVSIFKEAERRNIFVQASLERYVKCAVGLCGSCGIGPFRVCKDGPVFDSISLRAVMNELGFKKMDPSGRLIPVEK
ncbi:dihydroorotate dehydrogenase electron transfer subunit [Candidatus Bathyarchaeota archaeon]|nr:dihydroorotate dehydrogenase electron transfer subunit [Candidatus Bathyarchaeota archaeon]